MYTVQNNSDPPHNKHYYGKVHNEKINITEIKISIPSNGYRSTVLPDWVQLHSSGLNDAHRVSLITAHSVLSTKPTLVPPLLHY